MPPEAPVNEGVKGQEMIVLGSDKVYRRDGRKGQGEEGKGVCEIGSALPITKIGDAPEWGGTGWEWAGVGVGQADGQRGRHC